MVAGGCYHLINRGNNRSTVFRSPADYDAFTDLLQRAQQRTRLSLLAVCLMPNHFHVVAEQGDPDDITRWTHWLLTTFNVRLHARYGSCGRIWQGRFKAFPIERDEHLLTVMRYVERNALRAGLVARAEDWPWGSLAWREGVRRSLLSEPPVRLPRDWPGWVNAAQSTAELAALRDCVNRQRPFGGETWVDAATTGLGLESSRRPRGRPPKVTPIGTGQQSPRASLPITGK